MCADDRASGRDAKKPRSAIESSVDQSPRGHARKRARRGGPRSRRVDSETLARFHSALDLVELNVREAARRLRSGVVTLDDLRSLAREGLLHASRSFDPGRGTPFRRWANRRIRYGVAEGLRRWLRLPRHRRHKEQRQRAEATDQSKAVVVTEETIRALERQTEQDPERSFSECELRQRLREALARLPEPGRALVERHDLGGEAIAEVARSLGISKSWASRLHKRALDALACELGASEAAATGAPSPIRAR